MNQLVSSLKSQTVLGILGSGQLARMTALAASELGIITHIFCSESEISPAEHIASKTFKGSLADKIEILKFCEKCDFITLENEFIDQDILDAIDSNFPNRLFPNSKTFKLIGDKISEKESFQKAGIKIAPFARIQNINDVKAFCKTHGYPVVLKSAKGGYDGYGNCTIKNEGQIKASILKLKANDPARVLLVEAFIPYEAELAIMIARNKSEMVTYPIAHTIQENHICHYVSVPATLSNKIEAEIIENAKKAMTAIDAIGIFAFEFFLTKNGELYLNESAPRPHNSGHYTIEGAITGQFHNHVRSVLNLPLGLTSLRSPYIMMLNLLGTQNAPAELKNASDFLKVSDGHLHLYGKKLSKVGRKMGHFTLLGNNQKEMQKILEKLKSEYSL
ncbi:MAG: 5-(carboxyamino)imidazole ribonucleotide synthase [Bacteriovorax sp.]|nr:5-(carboxyamino)imidazole ribonucleotide synthase [Bacteriovorax sp.]